MPFRVSRPGGVCAKFICSAQLNFLFLNESVWSVMVFVSANQIERSLFGASDRG